MSILQIAKVWEHEFTAPHQVVMLALADHAHDDGTSIKPGLERVAWKTGYSLRQIKRIVKALRDSGVLVMTRNHGDGKPTEYRLDWSAAKAKVTYEAKGDILTSEAKVTPRVSKSDISGTPKVTSEVSKGDIVVSPEPSEPSLNHQEPSLEKTAQVEIIFSPEDLPETLAKKHEAAYFKTCLEIYRTARLANWTPHRTLQARAKTHLRDLANLEDFGATWRGGALAFQAALRQMKTVPWYADKVLSLENLGSNGGLAKHAKAFFMPQQAESHSDPKTQKVLERRERYRNYDLGVSS